MQVVRAISLDLQGRPVFPLTELEREMPFQLGSSLKKCTVKFVFGFCNSNKGISMISILTLLSLNLVLVKAEE